MADIIRIYIYILQPTLKLAFRYKHSLMCSHGYVCGVYTAKNTSYETYVFNSVFRIRMIFIIQGYIRVLDTRE